jgi:hypothetical protein
MCPLGPEGFAKKGKTSVCNTYAVKQFIFLANVHFCWCRRLEMRRFVVSAFCYCQRFYVQRFVIRRFVFRRFVCAPSERLQSVNQDCLMKKRWSKIY